MIRNSSGFSVSITGRFYGRFVTRLNFNLLSDQSSSDLPSLYAILLTLLLNSTGIVYWFHVQASNSGTVYVTLPNLRNSYGNRNWEAILALTLGPCSEI